MNTLHGRRCTELLLSNRLQAQLISDETVGVCAAALCINAGCMHDPRDLPGLAHLCEHMLLVDHTLDGKVNAYTHADHTLFYFHTAAAQFVQALVSFSALFLEPTFPLTLIQREVTIIDKEFNARLLDDYWRLRQLQRSFADHDHDFNKFDGGNRLSLAQYPDANDTQLRQRLLDFYHMHYSANLMHLVVFGHEPLSLLTELVTRNFGLIVDRKAAIPFWPVHPYNVEQLGYRTDIVPVNESLKRLFLSFPIPDFRYCKSKPWDYVIYLLNHSANGSLAHELRRLKWVSNVTANVQYPARGFGFFHIDIDLLDAGEMHSDEICYKVFQYLRMVSEHGPQEWLHQELVQLSNVRVLDERKKFSAKAFVIESARSLLRQSSGCVLELTSPTVPPFNSDSIAHALSFLGLDNVNIMIVSKHCAPLTTSIEPWYGTRFCRAKLTNEFIECCKQSASAADVFQFPVPNPYVSATLSVPVTQYTSRNGPELIDAQSERSVWYTFDGQSPVSKTCVFALLTARSLGVSAEHWALLYVLVDYLTNALDDRCRYAKMAGITCNLRVTKCALEFGCDGFSDVLVSFVRDILQTIAGIHLEQAPFQSAKEAVLRRMDAFWLKGSMELAEYYENLFVSDTAVVLEEVQSAIKGLTYQEFALYAQRFLSLANMLFYVHGSLARHETVDLAKATFDQVKKTVAPFSIHTTFGSSSFSSRRLCAAGSAAHRVVVEVDYPPDHSSVVVVHALTAEYTPRHAVVMKVLSNIIRKALRTECKRDRDHVQCSTVTAIGSDGRRTAVLRVCIQSKEHSTQMRLRLDRCIAAALLSVEHMREEAFQRHKKRSLKSVSSWRERTVDMKQLAHDFWREISAASTAGVNAVFDREEQEAEWATRIALRDIVDFVKMKLQESESSDNSC